ncbi:MAG: LPS export ABC transporter periplasmic protein LptC [Saprospiraceae bacterium]|nr:LPS export ABC transporter periplasmic protein LptC [Saprospiraceae bacterium]
MEIKNRSVRVFVFPFFIGLICLSACENDPADIEALAKKFRTDIETAKGVEILYSDSAQLKVRIEGETMLTYLDKSNPKQEFVDGMFVEFFGPNGEITSTLSSKYALRMEQRREMIVRDSVIWQSEEQGKKLETEELIWDEKDQKIYTNKFVVITSPDEIIYGHGFEADQSFENVKIKAIDGRVKVDDIGKELE